MTTHVFIVNEHSFKIHLEYLFVGTGSGDKDVDFNGKGTSSLHFAVENGLVGMMSDFSRVRVGDYVIFYVQSFGISEGKYYGIYKIAGIPFIEPDVNQYLKGDLAKNLTFRALIEPYEVYAEGVTEWEALDNISGLAAPYNMLWSLIYRKLKGNRGNTMITIYEAERLFGLIRTKNNNTPIRGLCYSFNGQKQVVDNNPPKKYTGNTGITFNILPRLIYKKRSRKVYEAHLQMFITQNLGIHRSLDNALGVRKQNVEWIGNEVSCGVGMQRIDIMFSQNLDEGGREIVPIELKAVPASEDNVRQISRYIDWIEQYYLPNRPSIIRPVLICPKSNLSNNTKNAFHQFNNNSNGRYLPLEYIEVDDNGNDLIFTKTRY